jgi:hypothetical protein
MLQLNSPSQASLKRTIRPTYGLTQATPKSGFLDPNWNRSVPIWPGMVLMRTSGVAYAEQAQSFATGDITTPPTAAQTGFPAGAEAAYTLINGVGVPAGLCGQYIGGDGIDELETSGVNALACWVLGPDAEFEILAPAFDPSLAWATADPGNGTDVLVYARTANLGGATGTNGQGGALGTTGLQGQLVLGTDPNASAQPVARLISVNSTMAITIGGLMPRHAF